MSYAAIVSKIHTRPHPNADRLLLGVVAGGNQVVVGKDTQDGELGVFFGPDGQLSHDFCLENGLYNAAARAELDLEPVEKPGFFSANRRVRSQNFRGVKSDGFWVPLSYLAYLNVRDLGVEFPEGTTFTEVNGQLVCEKYYTPATRRAMAAGKHKARKENAMFPKHIDTGQFRFLQAIPDGAIVYVTEKLHGTSGRYGLVLEEEVPTGWRKLFKRFLKPKQSWVYLNGSRNVILEQTQGPGFYGTNEFRYDVVKDLQLRKGEILFFEIVGYVGPGQLIMPPADTTKLVDKKLEKQYGKRMTYKYGCPDGTHRMYVYKILQLNEDGQGHELSWQQMNQRCQELGLQVVPQLSDFPLTYNWSRPESMEHLRKMVDSLCVGPSTLDPSHIREGVVLRIESSQGVQHVKHKSFEFGVLEGYIKEQEDYVDTEEIA